MNKYNIYGIQKKKKKEKKGIHYRINFVIPGFSTFVLAL